MRTIWGWLRGVGEVLWDLVVGDDWRIAVGIVIGLAVTAALAHNGIPAWWLLPLFVLVMLTASTWGAWRQRRDP